MHFIPELQDNMFRNIMARHPGAADKRWGLLTSGEIAGAMTEQRLVKMVETKYSLLHATACQDVKSWMLQQK